MDKTFEMIDGLRRRRERRQAWITTACWIAMPLALAIGMIALVVFAESMK